MVNKKHKDIIGVLLIAVSASVIGAGVVLYNSLPNYTYNAQTLCPDRPEKQRISIIVDRTDPFNSASRVQTRILNARDELDVHGRLVIFVINEDGSAPAKPVFDLCNPGSKDDVNPIYQNPRLAEEKYRDKFDEPLNDILRNLVKPGIAPRSPITQTLVNAISFETVGTSPADHTIVLISDLLENSSITDSYKRKIEYVPEVMLRMVAESYGSPAVRNNVSVIFDVVWRGNLVRRQQNMLSNYWMNGLESVNVTATHTLPSASG